MSAPKMTEPAHDNSNALGHEPIETDVSTVWKTSVAIVGVVVVSYLLIVGITSWYSAREGQRGPGQAPMADSDYGELPPLERLRIRESQVLGSYEWMDKEAQAARIPIERAMEIVAEAGVSAPLAKTQTTTPPSDQAASEAEETPAENGSSQE
jgi:hypothetical protein